MLEVTPLAIVDAPVDLVRSIEPADSRREEAASLVLRLKLKNISRRPCFRSSGSSAFSRADLAAGSFPDLTSSEAEHQPLSLGRRQRMGDRGSRIPVLKPGERWRP